MLGRFLNSLSQRKDLIMMVIVLISTAMMSFPMPDFLLDLVLAVTIALSMAIFVTSFYVKTPAELTTFPSFLLVSALMRLGATVASTRMLLLTGEAGQIIQVFGEFVIGGNLFVGIVVFLIILIVNFMVITKGSERVAEVSARFTLDAMPGKQMSIDAELKSGDIDKTEAQNRREILQIESQFYGSMDGAMKFVKGDAIASIIILIVNILGGMVVGPLYMDMTIGESLETFTIMSIGDAMVGQIPSTLVSIAAGIVITRISHNKMVDLGADIITDTFKNNNTNIILGVLMLMTAFIPGFPWIWFLLLALLFFSFGFKTQITQIYNVHVLGNKNFKPLDKEAEALLEERIPNGASTIEVFFSEELAETFDHKYILKEIKRKRNELIDIFGISIPPVSGIGTKDNMRKYFFTMNIDGIPVAEAEIDTSKLIVKSDHDVLQLADVPHEITAPAFGAGQNFHVPIEHEDKIKEIGVVYYTPENALLEQVAICMRSNLAHFMSMQEVQEWTNDAARNFPDLINEVRQVIQPQKMTEVFKRLLTDQISLSARRPLLEAIANWAGREEDPAMLAELIRVSIRRQICFTCADQSKIIIAAIFDPSVEEVVRQSVRRTNLGDFLALEPAMADRVMDHIKNIVREPRFMSPMPVILCSIDIRRFVRSYLLKFGIDIPVLSHQDIAEDFTVQVIYAIK
ncbi:MAG: type III secretion protein V [Alphaproteobacteria bacterium]|jgi:type III secretion protein V